MNLSPFEPSAALPLRSRLRSELAVRRCNSKSSAARRRRGTTGTSTALLNQVDAVAEQSHKCTQNQNGRRHATDPKFIFFDCDDTLYRNDWKTGDRLTQKIAQYTESELGVDGAKAYELYKTHGTCLKGLLAEGLLPRERIEEYLAAVHDVSLDEIHEDPAMRVDRRSLPDEGG